MADFEVATEDLDTLAKKIGEAGKALGEVATSTAGLTVPSDAFGRVTDSDSVHASYVALQQRLVDTSRKGSTLLDGVDEGLRSVSRFYSDMDASVTSRYEGE